MSDLTVIPFSWDGAVPWEPSTDDAYEQNLRTCRERFHDFVAGLTSDGMETLECLRCGTRMVEQP